MNEDEDEDDENDDDYVDENFRVVEYEYILCRECLDVIR